LRLDGFVKKRIHGGTGQSRVQVKQFSKRNDCVTRILLGFIILCGTCPPFRLYAMKYDSYQKKNFCDINNNLSVYEKTLI
jgi:hypothetical protein